MFLGPTERWKRPPCLGRGVPTSGFTLIETIVGILLLSFLLQGGWRILARCRAAAEATALEAEGMETIRTLAWILSQEISARDREWSWWWAGGDSVSLRVFRGTGLVEGDPDASEGLAVCFRGLRSPEPEKDSVLVLGSDGSWAAHRLMGRVVLADSCASGPGSAVRVGRMESWSLSPPATGGELARIFERGSYHLADRALRYRRGLGGRQPLTPERILMGSLRPDEKGERILRWEAALRDPEGDGASLPWAGRIR